MGGVSFPGPLGPAGRSSKPKLLTIIRSKDIDVDAMSPGEIHIQQMAGFPKERIFYIGNNVSAGEMMYAMERRVLVSADSLSQLELFGTICRGGQVAVRFNPGVGAVLLLLHISNILYPCRS